MSSLTTLARPYAKAAFDLASADNALADWDEMLELASGMAADEQLADLLDHPHVSASRVVSAMSDAAGDRFSDRFNGYLQVVAANHRLPLLFEISAMYRTLRLAAEKRLQVRVVSAVELEPGQAERMKAALTRRFEQEVFLQNVIDPDVLGGAVIYAGDQVIDGSLRGRLQKLSNSLSH
jgi:F-type H+-transporting ATPase subunit delta